MIFSKTEHAHLTSFFTAPNADRPKTAKKTPHAAEGKIIRFPKSAKPHGPEGFKTMAARSWNQNLDFTMVFTKRNAEKGAKTRAKTHIMA